MLSPHRPGSTKKPPESGGFPLARERATLEGLQPLGAAPPVSIAAWAAIPIIATIPVAAIIALITTLAPAAATKTAFHVGEDRKAALLAVVEGLVERVGGIGDLL